MARKSRSVPGCEHTTLTKVSYSEHTWICTTPEFPACHYVVTDHKALRANVPGPSEAAQRRGTEARVAQMSAARRARWEIIDDLRAKGASADRISEALGASKESLSRQAYRAGDTELGRFFGRRKR